MTHLVISKKLYPLADSTIEMILSKLVEFKDFTLFRGITTQDVKEHLLERRKIYIRVCELTNHPNIIGFLQSALEHSFSITISVLLQTFFKKLIMKVTY